MVKLGDFPAPVIIFISQALFSPVKSPAGYDIHASLTAFLHVLSFFFTLPFCYALIFSSFCFIQWFEYISSLG
jgi:hypothetical protein